MTINENPMNPVPLWDSKNKWQCSQKTFHDAMAWPVVEKGVLPKMALTLKGTMPNAGNNGKIQVAECSWALFNRYYSGGSSNADGTSTLTLTGMENVGETNPPNPMPQVLIVPQSLGKYKVTLRKRDINQMTQQITNTDYAVTKNSNGDDVFTYDEVVGGDETYKIVNGTTTYTFKLKNADINYHGTTTASVAIKRFNDNTTIRTMTASLVVDGCLPYYSTERCGHAWLGGDTLTGTFADGVYYLEVTFDNTTYYSEPFMWYSHMSNFTRITFRRSDVVVTRTNFIDFKNYNNNTYHELSMYIRNIDQRPPYQFNPEVTDIDGRKFAEKQVSFYNRRLAFNCYEAFLEAIRLLWHCDIRYMGNRRIDYMEPPEMDWNTDNHLCDVVLEMSNYDDVLQTNGTASSYFDSSDSSHQSYDNSFDNSFD